MNGRHLVAVSLLVGCAAALAADPPYYVKKGTWQETMIASREALAKYEAEQAGDEKGAWHLFARSFPKPL